MTDLCTHLYQNFDDQRWNEYDLATLPASELRFLCLMAGFPKSGTKEVMIVRLLSCRIVRLELSKFGDDPFEVAAAFKRSRLRWMCEQANLWKSGNKVQLSRVLLMWRNKCRLEGQKYYHACVEHTKKHGIQLDLQMT
jgi:hypothetical protein